MSSVSLSPVMKITGTWLNTLSRFSRRQISKPSIPGIKASMRMTSGVMRSVKDSACSPSSATSTVMPASSIASVSIRSVFGESSTTKTMLRAWWLAMAIPERLQDGDTALEIEVIGQHPHVSHKILMRGIALDRVQLFLDAAHIADLNEPDQLFDFAGRRDRLRLQQGRGDAVAVEARGGACVVMDPFDVEQRMNFGEQLAKIERLDQVVVIDRGGIGLALRIGPEGRQHNDRRAVVGNPAKLSTGRPAVHVRHRDVEQDQIRLVLLGEDQALGSRACGHDHKAERLQQFAHQVALVRVVVDHENGLLRAGVAADAVLHRRLGARIGAVRQQKLDPERAAVADLAPDAHFAAPGL